MPDSITLAFSIEHTLLPPPCQFEGGARDALDLAFGIALGVDAHALVAFAMMPRGSPK
jgi:uncharacterized membrane protein